MWVDTLCIAWLCALAKQEHSLPFIFYNIAVLRQGTEELVAKGQKYLLTRYHTTWSGRTTNSELIIWY